MVARYGRSRFQFLEQKRHRSFDGGRRGSNVSEGDAVAIYLPRHKEDPTQCPFWRTMDSASGVYFWGSREALNERLLKLHEWRATRKFDACFHSASTMEEGFHDGGGAAKSPPVRAG